MLRQAFGVLWLLGVGWTGYAAAVAGFYLGAQVGYSWLDYSRYPFPPGEKPLAISGTGLAPMYTFGYDFNQLVALEVSAYYPYKPVFKNLHLGENNARFKNNVVYLAFKLSYPVCNFGFFLKLGIGYVVRDNIIDCDYLIMKGDAVVRPVYGVGVALHVATHWRVLSTWMQAASSADHLLPKTNIWAVGAEYLFL